MNNKKMPNLFIIGAPKSGTTTLHHWLSLHPDVFMSRKKEPAYFCRFADLKWNGPQSGIFEKQLVRTVEEYRGCFAQSGDTKWRGESSTDYLWVPEAPYEIAKWLASAVCPKFIVILRNPVERAFSEHCHLIRDGLEKEEFVPALTMEDERYRRRWQPLFYHVKRGLYCEALKRYFSVFGRDSVKVIFFEELKKAPVAAMKEIWDFLSLNDIPLPTDNIYNRSGQPKSVLLHKLICSNTFITKLVKLAIAQPSRGRLRAFIENKNLKPVEITYEERAYAYQLFKNDINATEKLLGTDLSAWR